VYVSFFLFYFIGVCVCVDFVVGVCVVFASFLKYKYKQTNRNWNTPITPN